MRQDWAKLEGKAWAWESGNGLEKHCVDIRTWVRYFLCLKFQFFSCWSGKGVLELHLVDRDRLVMDYKYS